MNFCGTDQHLVYDGTSTTGKITNPAPQFVCGICTKVDSTDEDLSITTKQRRQLEHPMKTALDNIQLTLEESVTNESERLVVDCFVPQTPPRQNQKGHQRTSSLFSTMSPSPTLLNPLTNGWKAAVGGDNAAELCPMPTLSSGSLKQVPSGLDELLRRLEEGFSVRLVSGPSSCLSVGEIHSVCSHWDRSCLYLKTSLQHGVNAERREDLDCWIELPVDRIVRLESGVRRKSSRTFSLVLDRYGEAVYYDFEAATAVDREIIVTAILLLLETGNDGTMQQPIACSPSLDYSLSQSPSIENRLSHNEIRDDVGQIIHTEHLALPEKTVVDPDAEELRLDFKPSASSVNLAAVNSTQMTWCPADSCTLALNDIADTCTGIFEMKQSEHAVPQQGAIEEFIASALGAPSAVYTYLAMPEVWASQGKHDNGDRSAVQNRASVLNAQAVRLRTLRNEMTFTAALKQSKDRMQYLQTAESFEGTGAKRARITMAARAADALHTSPLLNSIVGNMDTYESRQDDQACYYDSDPEDYRPRTSKPRRAAAVAEKFDDMQHHDDMGEALDSIDFKQIGSQNRISRKVDEETISEIVRVSDSFMLHSYVAHPLFHIRPLQTKD